MNPHHHDSSHHAGHHAGHHAPRLRQRLAASLAGLALTVSLAAISTPALGDDAPRNPPRRGDDVLRGPKVSDGASKDDRAFRGGQGQRPGRGGDMAARRAPMQARLWMQTMREMDLPSEQREKVDSIISRFQNERQAWEEKNRETRRTLEQQVKDHGPDSAEGKEAREKMRALMEQAPKPEKFQEEAFAVLSREQQEAFRAKLADREAKVVSRPPGAGGDRSPPMGDEAREGRRPAGGGPPRDGAAGRGQRQRGGEGAGGAGGGMDTGPKSGDSTGAPPKDGKRGDRARDRAGQGKPKPEPKPEPKPNPKQGQDNSKD